MRHGFERVHLESMPFADQVSLIGSASILVGNHGAGLTNLAWMSPGSRVLELRRRGDGQNNCYYSLASALDLPYYYLLCDAVRETERTHTADILVNPIMLEQVLASVLG